MNRLRIRIGNPVKEHVIELPHDLDMPVLEDVIQRALSTYYQTVSVGLDYLGEYAWDVFLDGSKIGHVKAWQEYGTDKKPTGKQLWTFILLCVAAYLALC